ncbi:gas vesicle protein [Actinocatenispora sera]|uniref:gas vesicle protein GvpO n=1 Tax=Actinocatenispora sera TaxID=390989 RepID=UPI00316AD010
MCPDAAGSTVRSVRVVTADDGTGPRRSPVAGAFAASGLRLAQPGIQPPSVHRLHSIHPPPWGCSGMTEKTARRDTARSSAKRGPALAASRQAMTQLAELTGRTPDSVSALEPTDDGWRFRVEIVELERIPQTTSVLASYEVDADPDGNVVSYRRLQRYTRNGTEGPRQ